MVFSTKIFRNLDLGIEWVLRCKAMELESLRCIVIRLERVVVVRPTYILFSLETQSPRKHLNIYIYNVCPIKKFSGGGRVIGNNYVGDFKFVVVNYKSYFFGRISSENFFWIRFLVNVHLSYNYYEIGFCMTVKYNKEKNKRPKYWST